MNLPLDHWQGFADFYKYEKLSGGPGTHAKTIVEISKDYATEDKKWLAGLYTSVYNVPMALVLYEKFPRYENIEPWLNDNWKSIVMRRERRMPMVSPKKLARCLESYNAWKIPSTDSYEVLWKSADAIQGVGRYMKMKLLETLRLMGLVRPTLPDLRAKGGWGPRKGLSLLLPEHEALLNGGNDIRKIESLVVETQARLASEYNVHINAYDMQNILCDYRVETNSKQYPGKSLDRELDLYAEVSKNFEVPSSMFTARKAIFPLWTMGSWNGSRKVLDSVYMQHGYTWTDSIYDYEKTVNFEKPVVK